MGETGRSDVECDSGGGTTYSIYSHDSMLDFLFALQDDF